MKVCILTVISDEKELELFYENIENNSRFCDALLAGVPCVEDCTIPGFELDYELTVSKNRSSSLSQNLNNLASSILCGGENTWVLRVDPDEILQGDPERFRKDLEQAVTVANGSPLALQFPFQGPDIREDSVLVRALYRPEKWEFKFDCYPQIYPKDPSEKVIYGTVSKHSLNYKHLRSCNRADSVRRRKDFMASLDWPKLSVQEKGHYDAILRQIDFEKALSLCVIFREVTPSLVQMLESTRGHFDEYVLTCTGESSNLEGFPDLVEKLDLDGTILFSTYTCPNEISMDDGSKCIGHFADARNACFAKASGRWRMFLDSDDVLEWVGQGEAPKLRDLVRVWENNNINEIALKYIYSQDSDGVNVEQDRSRVWQWVDNKGYPLFCWKGPIHEQVQPTEFNDGARIRVAKPPGDVFVIRHKGTAESSSERNLKIAKKALESDEYFAISERAKLVYTIAAIGLENADKDAAKAMETIIKEDSRGTYSLIAGLDYSRWLLDQGDFRKASEILLTIADSWPDDREVYAMLGRAKRASGNLSAAVRYFSRAYFDLADNPSKSFDYRSISHDFEVAGRAEAVETFLDAQLLDRAMNLLQRTPEEYKTDIRLAKLSHIVQMWSGDARAAQAVYDLVHYYLSLDCVDKAACVLASVTATISGQDPVKKAVEHVQNRLKHFDVEKYVEVYDQLNESDLIVGYRAHTPRIVDKIVSLNPEVLYDVGCNTGYVCIEVAKRLPDCICYGSDIGAKRVEEAQSRAKGEGLADRVFFKTEPLEDSIIKHNGSKKTIMLCSEVIEHLMNPSAVFHVAYKICVDHLIVTAPDIEAYDNLVGGSRIYGYYPGAEGQAPLAWREHVRCLDAHDLVILGECAGFKALEVDRISILGEKSEDKTLLMATFQPQYFPKEEPRVDFFCKGYVPWGPKNHENHHVGGSEQAVIHLLPKLLENYNAHVYATPIDRLEHYKGVYWHHAAHLQWGAPRDLLVIWRRVDYLKKAKNAAKGEYPVVLWTHDVPDLDMAKHYNLADELWCLSEYQRGLYESIGVESSKIRVLQNGVDRESIEKIKALNLNRKPKACFYGSSADRGLLHLLRMWPKVREAHPQATLEVCYGMHLMKHPSLHPVWLDIANTCLELMESLPGVTYHGGLPHKDYLKVAAQCSYWTYPTMFDEISCIVAMETQALGLFPVCSDRAALEETVLGGFKVSNNTIEQDLRDVGAKDIGGTYWYDEHVYSEEYSRDLITALNSPDAVKGFSKLADQALEAYDWSHTASMFDACMKRLIHGNNDDQDAPQ